MSDVPAAARAFPRERPDNEVPVPLPWRGVLARSGDLVVALVGARVYRELVEIDVHGRSRRGHPELQRALRGQGRDRLLIGVQYADGRVAAGVSGPHVGGSPENGRPVLSHSRGSSNNDRELDLTLRLSPLPPPGDLEVYCAWPALELPETRTTLDTDVLHAAAEQVEVLWPPQPDTPRVPPAPEPPIYPAGGWFEAQAARGGHPNR